MRIEDVNAQAAANWLDIAARNKIAFFAVDVSHGENDSPLVTWAACLAEDAGTDEQWDLVRQKFAEFAAVLRDAVVPVPPAEQMDIETLLLLHEALTDLRSIRNSMDWPLRGLLNGVCDKLDMVENRASQALKTEHGCLMPTLGQMWEMLGEHVERREG